MRTYLKFISFIFSGVLLFGFVLPGLFSANSWECLIFFFLIIAAILPVFFWAGKEIWKSPTTQSAIKFLKGMFE